MKYFITLLALICFISGSAKAGQAPVSTQARKTKSISYWLWPSDERYPESGSWLDTEQKFLPDALYVKAGETRAWKSCEKDEVDLSLEWPTFLPKALSYHALVRINEKIPLADALAGKLASEYVKLKKTALKQGQKIESLQLDYDCPTEKLSGYASFLKNLRSLLGDNTRISITVLPDWFRKNTAISSVIAQVDEFVPQFYDIEPRLREIDIRKDATGITSPIDVQKWGPIFNSFGKPYRIGISAFGRALRCELAEGEIVEKPGKVKIQSFSKTDFRRSTNEDTENLLPLASLKSEAGERILRFEGSKYCSWESFTEVIVPTRESFMKDYDAAASFGDRCKGIIIFRWSLENEALVLTPKELAGYMTGKPEPSEFTLKIEDGFCATVQCSEIYLGMKNLFPEESVTVKIGSSTPIEYFIPSTRIKSRPSREKGIQFTVPPYSLNPFVYVGRIVTKKHADFSVRELNK